MVRVDIYRDNSGCIVKYVVQGHACYSTVCRIVPGFLQKVLRGGDVVCAAVSAITQSAVIGLKEVAGIVPGMEIDKGYLECIIPEGIDEKLRERADIILDTMALALKDIENQYGNHVRVNEMEV
jgi:uncharacterized protein YsxB (DUF464 family)